jgi:MtN3 and saliva related transmembrane protein
MTKIDTLGFLAGCLTTLSASPQLYYSYTTKDVRSISLYFLIMLMAGLFLWGLYGILLWAPPIIIFNFVGFALWLPVLWLKVKGKRLELGQSHSNATGK